MKKSLLALAVLGAFAGAVQAQSSITIYGSVDAGIRYATDVDAVGNNQLRMDTGNYNSNRLGFRGVEDLGGGMKAQFQLESGFNLDTGAQDAAGQMFNRTASVGFGGGFGSVDLGRIYTVAFKTIGAYDPFSYKYVLITPVVANTAGVRFNNDIQYTGNFGPATVRAEYALGETVGDNKAGSSMAVGGTFATGPFSVGAAYTKRKAPVAVPPVLLDFDHATVGGAFTTGPVRIAGGYIRSKQDVVAVGVADTEVKLAFVGATFTLNPAVALTGAYYDNRPEIAGVEGKIQQVIVGATYALSKRTNFYTEIDTKRNSGAVALAAAFGNRKQHGFSMGVNHTF